MEEIHAAICEDNASVLDFLHIHLKRVLKTDGRDWHFDCFLNGQELLRAISEGKVYQLLFIDIEMPGLNGIEVCRRIRAVNEECLIIFISNKENMVFETFEVQPFRFIRKSHFGDELPALADSIHQALAPKEETLLTLAEEHSSAVYSFRINEILYVEVIGKYSEIHTTTQTVSLRYKLSQLAEELVPHGFLQPHRSYLINCRYIFSIEKNVVILDDQTEVPLSRSRAGEIRKAFLAFSRR